MKKKEECVTSNELMNRLENDPDYQNRMAVKEERHRKRAEIRRAAVAPVINELKTVGVNVSEISEL